MKSLFVVIFILFDWSFTSGLTVSPGGRDRSLATRSQKLLQTTSEPLDSNGAGIITTSLYKIISSTDFSFATSQSDIGATDPSTGPKRPVVIQLGEINSAWGNGAHPTTKLCLDFIGESVTPGDKVLDYGTGSGVLSILAAKLGAAHCVAVDIDEETLRAAELNARLNGVHERLDVVHTKHVYVGEDRFPVCDVTVANILPGALSRLVSPIWSFTKPGGRLCLSGIRPHELPAIQRIYSPYVDSEYSEVRQASHPMYGDWVAWFTRMRVMSAEEVRAARQRLTEMSVS